ncbi:hypothetical protein SG72_16270 [Enterobacter cloacae subsp. cloacae]|nr:hypothetical protein SG72_16270 [Enterobacter cloacae subsp. cloacae]
MLIKSNFNDISITHPKISIAVICDTGIFHPAVTEVKTACHLKNEK